MSISFEFRTYFSIQLLMTAKLFCDNSYNIESKYAKEFLTMGKEEKHRLSRDNISFVTGSIISCVNFLEANINEFYGDAYDKQYNDRLEPLSGESIKLIGEIWGTIDKEKKRILYKYNKALELVSKEKFNKGMEPYQSVCLLINLRNKLVHYKTETLKSSSFDPKNKHGLEKKLSNKFIENSFYKFTGNPYYPEKLLGYGCAKWAFNSVVLLADEFYSKMGVKPYYEHVRDEVINKDLKEIDISGIINHYDGIKNQHKSSNNNGERIVAAPFEIKLDLIEIDNKIELF